MKTKNHILLLSLVVLSLLTLKGYSQSKTDLKQLFAKNSGTYIPDFSYAGYQYGEKPIPNPQATIVNATDFGVIANDNLDDSKALLKAIESCQALAGNVILQLPAGKIILSSILYMERSNFILRGAGTDQNGTEIYCPRPMMYLKDPESLTELREYLLTFDKRQREKENNIDLPFSQYAWSGGMIWTQIPGERVKSYLEKYDPEGNVLAKITTGKRGDFTITATDINSIKKGDVVELQLFNKDGQNGEIIKALYNNAAVKPGSHHWQFPTLPLVRQQVEVVAVQGNKITLKDPLMIDIKAAYAGQLVEWKHLSEVGIENFRITFPDAPRVAHHVEPGYNGIFLTRLFNSWVKNVTIHNADSGILTEEIANTTLENITTEGANLAHYTVALGGVHNILIKNLKVFNEAVHPLSFNTFSTKNVYQYCTVYKSPILDQHSGLNHQNLFDATTVYIEPNSANSYPIFGGGGADYWKPSHAAFSAFWNLNVQVPQSFKDKTILLNGLKDGPFASLIGVHGNANYSVSYEPNATISLTNQEMVAVPSLYDYQLQARTK
jgi:hypothetical protein